MYKFESYCVPCILFFIDEYTLICLLFGIAGVDLFSSAKEKSGEQIPLFFAANEHPTIFTMLIFM